jgi:hypothetical protein
MIEGKPPRKRGSWCGWRRPFACEGNEEPEREGLCKWKGNKKTRKGWKCKRAKKYSQYE